MNSRSGVNETNLVNFSADLSTLNQLDTKDSLLSFPFDHIYACHSEGSERRQTLQLDKEVEISTHCVVSEDKDLVVSGSSEITQLTERLTVVENQNRKLKDLLVYHLDLIQQQNEILTKKDKLYQALKQENDSLKTKLSRMDRRVAVNQRHSVNPPPLVHVPGPSVTSTIVKNEPSSASQIMLNSFTELLLPDSRTNSFIFESDLNNQKAYGQESFEIARSSEPAITDLTSYLSGDLGVSSILENKINCDNYTMIESKRSLVKKELKTENRSEPLYTVTTNSGNPIIQRIQRNRRRSTGLGSLSRMSKSPGIKVEPPESKAFDDPNFTVHKKSKMINTYGKSKQPSSKRTIQFTGSLSDRLQLIDTTPTGEDPYQLGEADMREQSPIPKLMLQKTNHGRMKICTDTSEESSTSSRRICNSNVTEGNTKASNKVKLDRYHVASTYLNPSEIKSESPKTLMVDEPDLDIVKTEPEIDWRIYNPNKPGNETSLCDFSYGETPNNLTSSVLPPLDSLEFEELFAPESPLQLGALNSEAYTSSEKNSTDKSRKRASRTTSLLGPNFVGDDYSESKRTTNNDKRGRKRALSTTGLVKNIKRENSQKGTIQKPKIMKGKAPCRVKVPKSPVPAMVTQKPYFTLVGDPDLSWYLGLDPGVKLEDVDQTSDSKVSSVEVPRWREKPYTSTYTLEGTENLDDKVFEKRHQKLEAEERRQLRWHMRRIREQRHVERLRQRQRDPWSGGGGGAGGGGGGGGSSPARQPAVFTVWPQPQRDLRYIEITDTLPVTAFGELLPSLPESDFVLPWVKTSKAMKRSKRSKTLH